MSTKRDIADVLTETDDCDTVYSVAEQQEILRAFGITQGGTQQGQGNPNIQVPIYLITSQEKFWGVLPYPKEREYHLWEQAALLATRKYKGGLYHQFTPRTMSIAPLVYYSIVDTHTDRGIEIQYIPFDIDGKIRPDHILSISPFHESEQKAEATIKKAVPACQKIPLDDLQQKVRLTSASFEE